MNFIHWLQQGIQSNVAAWIVCGAIAWFWKIGPHFKKEKEHREYMQFRTEQLHKHLGIKT